MLLERYESNQERDVLTVCSRSEFIMSIMNNSQRSLFGQRSTSLLSPFPTFFCLDFQLLCVLYFSEWSCFLSKIFHHLDTNSTLCISNLNFWNDKYVIIFQKKKKFLIWISATFSEMLPGSISVKILLGHTIIVSCISYCNSHFNGLLKPYSLDLKVPTKLQADHMLFAKELPLS